MDSFVRELSIAEDVNVFCCGDIHGAFDLLIAELLKINFDFKKDLLISVGDLVDRGLQNEKCVTLLKEPWFLSVRGNHEDFCIQGHTSTDIAEYHVYRNNGGSWFYKLPLIDREKIVSEFKKLPYLLEIKYREKVFGFVHADVPDLDWNFLKQHVKDNVCVNDRPIVDLCVWSRNLVYKDTVEVKNIDNVFLGHTVLPYVKQVGNCTFLDTGAVFKKYDNGYKLSIVNLKDYC